MPGHYNSKAEKLKNRILYDQEAKNTTRAGLLRQYAALTQKQLTQILGSYEAICMLDHYLSDAELIEDFQEPNDAIELVEEHEKEWKYYLFLP